jgi:hypothetical protein
MACTKYRESPFIIGWCVKRGRKPSTLKKEKNQVWKFSARNTRFINCAGHKDLDSRRRLKLRPDHWLIPYRDTILYQVPSVIKHSSLWELRAGIVFSNYGVHSASSALLVPLSKHSKHKGNCNKDLLYRPEEDRIGESHPFRFVLW